MYTTGLFLGVVTALANGDAGELADIDVFAQLGNSLGDQVTDGDTVILDERLVEQDDVRVRADVPEVNAPIVVAGRPCSLEAGPSSPPPPPPPRVTDDGVVALLLTPPLLLFDGVAPPTALGELAPPPALRRAAIS